MGCAGQDVQGAGCWGQGRAEAAADRGPPSPSLHSPLAALSAPSPSTTIRLIASQTPHPGREGAAGPVRRPGCRRKAAWRQRLGTAPSLHHLWAKPASRQGRGGEQGRTTGLKDQMGRCVICLSHSGHGSPVLRGEGTPSTTFTATPPNTNLYPGHWHQLSLCCLAPGTHRRCSGWTDACVCRAPPMFPGQRGQMSPP